ncbi:DNA binding protein [Mycobacterium phage Kamiyu]|uniref:Rnase E n=1 Tax=Mycobacterium phage Phaedrus TaxID=546184 RepID=UPI00017992D4|nr:Rnase E [Mycobacterium phage Phaedrus]YP_002564169.1 Rnase E [Mycobacterium phage Phlyer]AER50202.1 DNA binding protein [Mycobacterium phage Kamiyu]AHN84287.1 hypothetical protein HEATHCLIFF_71 [Mycobacterium phage Heathcliff]AJD82660.1 hypothetical protein CHANDLER_71 [Mycobacterium phage Chandler]AWY03787.1 hypothetical protein MORTCELLUS_71 [Mycobacterium phage Mortcellus]AXH48053.1 hypothetical protein SEA_MORTY007_70 [Mycobacterium phage Morty007]AZF93873.1 hypothetical protein SEA_M
MTALAVSDFGDDEDRLWERRFKIMSLYNGGLTYRQIAQQYDISTTQARKDHRLAMQAIVGESVDDMLARQRSILHDVVKRNYAGLLRGDKDSTGHVLKALDQEAKLFGLNAPARVSVGISDTEFAEKLADLLDAVEEDDLKELRRARPATRDIIDAEVDPWDDPVLEDGEAPVDRGTDGEGGGLRDDGQPSRPPGWSNL